MGVFPEKLSKLGALSELSVAEFIVTVLALSYLPPVLQINDSSNVGFI